jgi:8-oxo-dGTP pyrophosphatase MutT (NUDIX family)
MLKEEIHKAIAIPVTFVDEKPKFLTVRDRRHRDWIFVTGGCRKKEIANPIYCALRELEEETRGVMKHKSGLYTSFTFKTDERGPEELEADKKAGIHVTLVYHVFIFFTKINSVEQHQMIQRFNEEKEKLEIRKKDKLPYRRTFDENDIMSFDTLESFKKKKRWDLIVKNIINNPEFYSALNSLNRKTFNIR